MLLPCPRPNQTLTILIAVRAASSALVFEISEEHEGTFTVTIQPNFRMYSMNSGLLISSLNCIPVELRVANRDSNRDATVNLTGPMSNSSGLLPPARPHGKWYIDFLCLSTAPFKADVKTRSKVASV